MTEANQDHTTPTNPDSQSSEAEATKALTPMMQQYLSMKQEYPKAILFFRLGDFYEMFGEDAKIASKILSITLTSRDKNKEDAIPLCGVPYHAADGYIARLIKAGLIVAICEQVEDPKKAKGVVKREVVRVITPGTVTDSQLLEGKENNFLASLYLNTQGLGIALVDLSTGELWATEYGGLDWQSKLETELFRKAPRELLIPPELLQNESFRQIMAKLPSMHLETLEENIYQENSARQLLLKHFGLHNLTGLGCEGKSRAILATATALIYLQKTQKSDLAHLRRLRWYELNDFMILDPTTQQHLELFSSGQGSPKGSTLLSVLDFTETPMGGRMLKQWMLHPLLNLAEIKQRLEAVEYFVHHHHLRKKLRELLKEVYDLERISGKIALFSASPPELISLRHSLAILPQLKALVQEPPALLFPFSTEGDALEDIYQLIYQTLADHPPATLQDSGIIREGYSSELDELRQLAFDGKTWLSQMEHQERQKTGISSLKIRFNKVFGYYLEVTKTHLAAVPSHYIRKQTIANGERYITVELKEYENKILTAQERMLQLEKELYHRLLTDLAGHLPRLQETSRTLAMIDTLASLAEAASLYDYVKPLLHQGSTIQISEGRHPVVERLSKEEHFVPNDTILDSEQEQILIITGPNMAGKSTYIRQVALITLLAQMGSFVPAKRAEIGLVDRIFTRVGASDNLAKGQSTFMVEMSETANILNQATKQSLIILDEIGRGTSTFDGLSIAWAVAEYLHREEIKAKTLFATHYHELTRLSDTLERVRNYTVLVREWNEEIVFLRRIVAGSCDKSYGIQVARLAGIPSQVLQRAKEILLSLEKKETTSCSPIPECKGAKRRRQLSLFVSPEEYVVSELRALTLEKMSWQDVLKAVKAWQKLLRE